MKPILRNFLSVIRRFKLAMVLNILGLSIAFAVFMIIMIQLDYDLGFDKFHKDSDKIFRLEVVSQTHTKSFLSRPMAELFIESSPHILAGALSRNWEEDVYFYIEKEGKQNYFKELRTGVSPEFTDVFTFNFVEGSKDALKAPENIMIPLSLSRKLFGNESVIGKQVIFEKEIKTIAAVYRDFPANTILSNIIYYPIPEHENKQHWGNSNYGVYIRVNDAANVPQLFDNFKRNSESQSGFGGKFDWDESETSLRFTALPDIHFVTDVRFDRAPKASKQTLMILLAIAIVIITIAAINFTNFSTALTPMRVKSINTHLVLGVRRNILRKVIVFESIIISLLSYIVALLLVFLFHGNALSKLIDADLLLTAHPLIVGGTALVALLTGLFAGLYPSRYMTSFSPALVVKGSYGLSKKGKSLRNTLIGIQFAASLALIIGASFMYLQNHFMQNSPLGYDKDEIITVNIEKIRKNREAFTYQLKAFSGIEDVTFGESLLSGSDIFMGWGRIYNGERIDFNTLPVHYTFLKVMGIEVTEGRNFRQEDENMEEGVFIFNETARKKYDLELNTRIRGQGEIIGFMPDIKFASSRVAIEPMAFFVWGTDNWGTQPNNAYIRVKAGTDMRAAMTHIRNTLAGFDANYPFEIRFYDEVLQRLYKKETALSSLISLFSLIAIFISIVGVFGLVVFDSECRRKEIGIRKVLGASVIGIILMFNKSYFKILLICFVIAAPLAWYIVYHWLENFAYKTPMYWWVYLLAFAAIGIITAATVTFQNWRVANDNPVNSIKTE